jgi:ankyrin repeat protein
VCAVAAAAGKLGVAKLLLAAGCSASLRNDEGLTALELAEQLEQSGVAGVLRAHINRPIQMHKSLTLDS